MPSLSIVWLRDDLRVADNPALAAAVTRGEPVVVMYLLDEVSEEIRPLGGASRWWLHYSLEALRQQLESLGGSLVLRSGAAAVEIPRLVAETGAGAIFWNRRYAASRAIDAALKLRLRADDVLVESFQANLLFEPWTISTGEGNPYRVFTPFWRACLESPSPRATIATPTAITVFDTASEDLDSWMLLPTSPDWAGGLRDTHTPGEDGAWERLEDFATGHLAQYDRRDFPAEKTTSELSPHLRFGEISPFQIWERINAGVSPALRSNADKFLREIGWREFNWHILFHFTALATDNFRSQFDAFPWQKPRPDELVAWQQGRTGIPLVDAGMRELWATGVMHNRVRMVTASLLVKNLLVDWRVGEAWFWDTLVDADEASNPANWQWVAGSGADAAPYFRVFNPALQGEKFDPEHRYVAKWIPELGTDAYPQPIVDLGRSRKDALSAYEMVKATQA